MSAVRHLINKTHNNSVSWRKIMLSHSPCTKRLREAREDVLQRKARHRRRPRLSGNIRGQKIAEIKESDTNTRHGMAWQALSRKIVKSGAKIVSALLANSRPSAARQRVLPMLTQSRKVLVQFSELSAVYVAQPCIYRLRLLFSRMGRRGRVRLPIGT